MAMLITHVIFHEGFSTKACHMFGMPQTWEVNIYICVGTSLIWWLDGKLTLSHGFSVPDTPSFQYGHAHQPCVFSILASQARHAIGLEGLRHGK